MIMGKTRNRIIVLGIFILITGVGFSLIRNKDLEIVKNLDIYCTLFRELNMFYVDETVPEELVTTSINSMLNSLDPYTTYIPEKEMDNFNFQTTGEYGGIGSLIRKDGTNTIIADPYQGFPATRAGLRHGDILLKISGKDVRDMDIAAISELLKGKPGTELTIKYRRPYTEKTDEVRLVRERIIITNVPYYGMLDGHTGYIRLRNFTTDASREVRSAFRELKKNEGFDRLVLDLRGNPGGLMIEAVRVSNIFIEKDEMIVSTRGKVEKWDNAYKTTEQAIDTEIPLVVLVNRGSASAAEIVAGAMQDLDRAVVIGQRTFGKGLVQTTRPLKYNAQLKVTTAKYYIPSGRCIQALDYSNRNEDGSVGSIPDSLITEFSTRNGRPVYDGGGVSPDIEVVPETLSEITLRLFTENVYFNYATKFRTEHPAIADPVEFNLTDQQYELFKDFVVEKEFEYETASEQAYRKLVKTAKREKYFDLAREEFEALENKLSHNNLQDMITFREEIEEILEEEIVGRYYYHAGQIRHQINQDRQVDKALEVISDPGNMQQILEGKSGAHARHDMKESRP